MIQNKFDRLCEVLHDALGRSGYSFTNLENGFRLHQPPLDIKITVYCTEK